MSHIAVAIGIGFNGVRGPVGVGGDCDDDDDDDDHYGNS